MPDISRRAQQLGTENAFVVLAEVNALARQGKDIVSFCIGQPDFPAPEHVQQAAIRAIKAGKHGYTPSAGIDELRAAAAKYLAGMRGGLPIRPEDVVVGAGAKPFIAYAILSTTDYGAGDEVIYPNPGFPIYESQILANGAKPVPIHLHEARDFTFDVAELERLITPRTRLLILNYPHNPTGGTLTRKDLEAIAAILRRHPQVWVYADEIYSRLSYAEAFYSIAQVPGMLERTIISDGASKTWAMTGWRIGFTANAALAPVFTRWITNTDSCASQISQWAAVEAINGPQDAAERMRASFLERRDLIVGLLNQVPGVTCRNPGGAFYAWPNVTEACKRIGAADSEEFRKRLLNEAGVAVLADIHFGSRVPGEGQHLRFSYAASKQAIEQGVARMAEFIGKNTRKAA
ncbi:MAG: pyridoxal phosphate-dependent aminotransferase [Betaproteobacteria bacterium]|nr:pyridoxal phosphate-dependent aminotransferase [Betaproteobacteria bacterium]MDH5220967.1 pyridoxal phosphate-dependent aminotransferase [Betaproteobacteria bacterium]MDH5350272.1 pyridoxal phosphate-dependent aminotransferase [Betaproteobacteria bacterium]